MTKTLEIPTVDLSGDVAIPQFGLGVFQVPPENTVENVLTAIELGYRHIDTAKIYGNEAQVGQAIHASGLPRDAFFITTKLWNSDHADGVGALKESLSRLEMGHVEAWKALIEAQQAGLTRAIGVSNFQAPHLRRIIDETGVTPAVNQIELHPYFPQEQMRAVNAELGIRTQAWSPMGKRQAPFDEPPVADAAAAHGVTPGQVILRWHVQLGSLPLPKSATPARQRANLDVFGFELTEAEMAAITALARPDGRLFGGD